MKSNDFSRDDKIQFLNKLMKSNLINEFDKELIDEIIDDYKNITDEDGDDNLIQHPEDV